MMALTPRAQLVTRHLNLGGSGVEYGPLHKPLVPSETFDVLYVDYASSEHLKQHYQSDPAVDVDRLKNVDIVTGGKSIDNFIEEESIDYVIASHVVEHVPDLVGWLVSNLKVLKRGGRVGIAYPDRRYCFDLARRSTQIPDLLAAYYAENTRPTIAQIADYYWNVVKANPADCWSGAITKENAERIYSMEMARDIIKNKALLDEYVDCHCWVFTDMEFKAAIMEIRDLLDLEFRLCDFVETPKGAHEFFATIEKT